MESTGTLPIILGISIIFLAILYRFSALLITIFKNSKCTIKETARIIKIEEKTVSYKKVKQSMKTIVYIPIYQYVVNGNFYTFSGAPEETNLKKLVMKITFSMTLQILQELFVKEIILLKSSSVS